MTLASAAFGKLMAASMGPTPAPDQVKVWRDTVNDAAFPARMVLYNLPTMPTPIGHLMTMWCAVNRVTPSVTFDRPLTQQALEALLDDLPAGVMRVKGIVRLADSPDQRTVVHRVASRRSFTSGGPWRTSESSRIVFIALAGSLAAEALAQGPPIELSDPAAGQ